MFDTIEPRFASKAPFPWFGGKSQAAPLVWSLLGDVDHYCEPFAGSLAVLLNRPHPCNRAYYSETVNDIDGFVCLAPETRVLMHDLSWKKIGDVIPGEKMWGFDEHQAGKEGGGLGAPPQFRRWRVATCLASTCVKKPCFRLAFSDGTEVIASEDHMWLGGGRSRGYRWLTTKSMYRFGHTAGSHVVKLCEVAEKSDTWDAGWLAGFFDGEGHLTGNFGWALGASQAVGPTLERAKNLLAAHRFAFRADSILQEEAHHKPKESIWLRGGMRETLRFLMTMRPGRLVPKAMEVMPSKSIYARERCTVALVHKEFLGEREVIALETDCHTFVAEGLASHNCNAWRALAAAPDVVAEAASWPVSECDKSARQIALLRWRDEVALERLAGDPHWFDPVMAGWWLWAVAVQIGAFVGDGAWTADRETGRIYKQARGKREPGVERIKPQLWPDGRGVLNSTLREPGVSRDLPHLTSDGSCVNSAAMREPGVRRKKPHLTSDGQGVNNQTLREPGVSRDRPFLGNDGQGVCTAAMREPGVARGVPHLGNDGRGVCTAAMREPGVARKVPHLSDDGRGVNTAATWERGVGDEPIYHPTTMPKLRQWFALLQARLRHVRILNGDWSRLCTKGATHTLSVRHGGVAGVFLDPPYANEGRASGLYSSDDGSIIHAVRAWALKAGTDPQMRIVLAGFDTEHTELEAHGWSVHEWFAKDDFLRGGLGDQQHRERLWSSPHCLALVDRRSPQLDMFA